MPDLSELMRDAASQAGSRPVDIEAVVRRGDRLRVQRTITRASSPVLVVIALLLVLPQVLDGNTVKFLPSDPPGAVASPPADAPDASEAPATKAERRRQRLQQQDGSVLPIQGNRRRGDAAAAATAVTSGGTRGPVTGGTTSPNDPGDPPVDDPNDPGSGGRNPGADPPQKPGEPAPRYDPPPAEYCDIHWTSTPPGGATTCAYTATHAGGFNARNNYRYVYHPNPSTAPDYWSLEIRRGSETFRYDNHNHPSNCSDDAIRPGDIVTATVHRPAGADDPFSLDLFTGRNRSCNS